MVPSRGGLPALGTFLPDHTLEGIRRWRAQGEHQDHIHALYLLVRLTGVARLAEYLEVGHLGCSVLRCRDDMIEPGFVQRKSLLATRTSAPEASQHSVLHPLGRRPAIVDLEPEVL